MSNLSKKNIIDVTVRIENPKKLSPIFLTEEEKKFAQAEHDWNCEETNIYCLEAQEAHERAKELRELGFPTTEYCTTTDMMCDIEFRDCFSCLNE